MFKLIKYEYRRNLSGIVVMLTALVGLQAYFLLAAAVKSYENVVTAAAVLAACSSFSIFGVLIYSISLYSRELNAKTSYLTFMTPNASAKILGSKLLATLILGCVFALMLCLFAAWDFSIILRVFPELNLAEVMLNQLLANLNTDLSTVFLIAGSSIVEFLISFFSTVVLAYLAITLSATVFQNKKFKGIVSFLIFALIMVGLNYLTFFLPKYTDYRTVLGMMQAFVPTALVHLAAMLAAFFLSAYLLDKKVSL
ncbi:MAG: hypothetical protein RSJ41_09050 [Clostridia bacterium]